METWRNRRGGRNTLIQLSLYNLQARAPHWATSLRILSAIRLCASRSNNSGVNAGRPSAHLLDPSRFAQRHDCVPGGRELAALPRDSAPVAASRVCCSAAAANRQSGVRPWLYPVRSMRSTHHAEPEYGCGCMRSRCRAGALRLDLIRHG